MSGITLPLKNLRLRVGGLMLMLLSAFGSVAQSDNIGIGTTKPDNSALLDLTSTSKGLLIPRMTLAQRAGIKTPAAGLMVYQIDFFTGFYFFDGAVWKGLYARNTDGAAFASDPAQSVNTWNIGGNSGLNSDLHFLGTLDTTSLAFKVNNYRSGLIDFRFGNTYFGYRAGYRSHGFNSIAIGAYALYDSNLGLNNIAIGYQSMLNSQTGSDNVAVGANSLYSNKAGSQNVSLGTQAGQRSVGDGNIFIGYRAGMNEIGNNKLYIDNNLQDVALIYGDFEKSRVGINTISPESALSIDSKVANISGLEFKNLNSSSLAGKPNQKVLSVDSKGRVILVKDSVGTGSDASSWLSKGSSIENTNTGDVIISNIRFKSLRTISPAVKPNGKVLTVDDNGLLVLTRDSIGATTPSYWVLNGGNLSNTNAGKLILNGSIQLSNIKASNTAFRPHGKVLTVDDNGNLILVRDSVATTTASTTGTIPVSSSPWDIKDNNITNNNSGAVYINNNLILSKLSSDNTVTESAQKFLTVNNSGNVILANIPPSTVTTTATSDWNLDANNLTNKNTGGVYINNGLWAKNGFRLQSGILELNSAVENKSGLQFAQLKASNLASKSNGKVLSVDDNGNVILVKDSVGVSTVTPVVASPWTATGSTIVNSNTGKVVINNGLTLPITSETNTTLSTQKFLTVDNAGNVVLGNVTNNTPSPWTTSGNDIINSNLGKTYINNGLSVKSGVNIESGNLITNGSVTNRSGLVLNQLKLSFPASKPSGKVLSVDDNGNVILVRDSIGVAGTTVNAPSIWTASGDNITNANTGAVSINTLTLPKLSSNDTPTVTTQKVLSVDTNGNVILVNTPTSTSTTPTTELWKAGANGTILNNNNQGVVLTANADDMSGLQFTKLKASSAAGNRYGKVLSVDDNGNVILVNDGITSSSNNTGAGWTINDGRLQNSNNGKVVIGTGINSFPGDFQLYVKGGILTERVRVAVANSDRWADYVFETGYKLMSLRDVEKHINFYHHLPNVPSAEEMSKNGMDVMETSAKLLEKIEELTLYLIKANKQIETLEAKVSNLEKVQK